MIAIFRSAAAALFLLLLSSMAAHAERRVALVVGNAAYQHATRLQNPVNDAIDVKAKLEKLGFDVTLARDQSSDAFFDAVQAFSNKLAGADLALFYYSGHGMQFEGTNYLVPVDTRIDGQFTLKRRAVSAQDVVEQMERGAKASLVFLDACRNNTLLRDLEQSLPSQSRASAVNRGLARMDAKGSNTLIVFATAPNDVAADGTGSRNSPFTSALLKHIETPNVVIQEMLTDVAADVERATSGRQKPEVLVRLTSKIRLAAATPVPPPAPPVVPATPTPSKEREASIAWEAVRSTCDRDSLAVFRQRYGDTFFGDLAKQREGHIAAGSACAVAAKSEPSTEVPPKASEPVSPLDPKDDRELVVAIQTELKRLGCFDGAVDGRWGRGSGAALNAFNRYSKASPVVLGPTSIDALRSAKQRVCPLQCPEGQEVQGAACQPKTAPPEPVAKAPPAKDPVPTTRSTSYDTSSCTKKTDLWAKANCTLTNEGCKSSGGTLKDCNAAFRECMATGKWVYRRPNGGACFDWGTRERS